MIIAANEQMFLRIIFQKSTQYIFSISHKHLATKLRKSFHIEKQRNTFDSRHLYFETRPISFYLS